MSVPDSTKACHIIVHGRVQGVGFRYHTRTQAKARRVFGWVANLSDGTVEIRCEGSERAMTGFLAWLKSGPPGARVTALDVRDVAASGYKSFTIEY